MSGGHQSDRPEITRLELVELLARATRRCPFKVWGFGESIAMEGLIAAGGDHWQFARLLIATWAERAGPLPQDPLAHVAPGVPLLLLSEDRLDERLDRRALELASVLAAMRRGTGGARLHRPDLAGWEHEVWVDCMHLDGPFLARLGVRTGEARWHDLAAELLLTHARVLQDETSGLFSHGFNDATGAANGVHWGRGQGWALLGLCDTLSQLPAGHPARVEIQQRLSALVSAIAATEVEGGKWSTVIDHPETYLEPSTSAFFALGLHRAIRQRFIPGTFASVAERALAAVIAGITPEGELAGVSNATPVGDTVAHYQARAVGVWPWGQGPALLAILEAPSLA